MTKTYDTETGHYVLVDSNGRVFARAAPGYPGKYNVSDRADLTLSHDVESQSDLESYPRNTFYDDPNNW